MWSGPLDASTLPRSEHPLDILIHDLRYAARSLRRSPAFTIAAVLTLAIGIGASAAILSVVNRVLLRPPPFAEVDRLAMVWETDRASGTTREPASIPDFVDFRARSRAFESFAAITPVEMNVSTGQGDPERVAGLGVSAEFFSTVGLAMLAGRTFLADEDRPGGPRAVIISEELWTRAFDRSPQVIGRTLRLNEIEWEVVGIAARGADFGTLQVLGAAAYMRSFVDKGGRPRVDIWVPLRPSPEAQRGNHPIFVVARLAPGVGFASAQEEMTRITADLEREYPQANEARGAFVEPFTQVVFGEVRAAMYVLVAAVGLVLLVACVNVANLLLARSANRTREVTVRTALGANSRRLARQFAVEAALLVSLGAALGTLLAFASVNLLRALAPATIPRAGELQLDGSALLVTAGISLAIAFVFGLLPTLHARRANLVNALQSDGRGAAGSRPQKRLRSALVVTELAMATTLTVGAVLLIRSLWTLQNVDPGFDASQVLKAEFQLPNSRYPVDFSSPAAATERLRFQNEVITRLSGMPGIEAVALATANPMDAGFTSSIRVVGRESEANGWPEPSIRTVSAGYFETLRVPTRGGRAFVQGDDAAAPRVVVINESAASRYFEGRDPIGAQINLWGAARTVIGVVGNERIKGLAAEAPPAVYLPLGQVPTPSAILVRTSRDAAAAIPLVRQVVRDVDPQLLLFGMEPLAETIQGTMAQRRFTMLVLAAFALAALVLAAIGVHGVFSYTVAQRTREIGIRVALGADLARVRRLVLGDGAQLTALGVGIGILGAVALSGAMRSLLFGVGAYDPVTFAGVAALLTLVALLACWFPARRAARVDPTEALRAE
jgi:putative ABC transport system permease protein